MSAAGESLDDAHASAAAGTDLGRGWRVGVIGSSIAVWSVGSAKGLLPVIGGGDEFSKATKDGGALWAGEEAVVADAVEAIRQYMEEEAADELVGRQRHRLDPCLPGRLAAGAIVLPAESDAGLVEPDQPRIGDGDAVGVAGEIGEHGFRPGKGSLGVDHPRGAAQRRERGVEGAFVGKGREIAGEGE